MDPNNYTAERQLNVAESNAIRKINFQKYSASVDSILNTRQIDLNRTWALYETCEDNIKVLTVRKRINEENRLQLALRLCKLASETGISLKTWLRTKTGNDSAYKRQLEVRHVGELKSSFE